MNDWAAALEQLGVAQALKTSFFVYPLINATHVLAIGALMTCVILMDLRLLGCFANLPRDAFVAVLRRVALGGFALAVASGFPMFAIRATEYVAMPLYWVKMGLIGLAGLNFLTFSALDRSRSTDERLSVGAKLSVLFSLVLWPCVLLAGRFLGFV